MSPVPVPARTPLPILVLDDSSVARAAVHRALVGAGFAVHVTSTFEEAAALEPTAFGAAVLDIEVGEASGVDLAVVLRARDPGVPIAFLTATQDPAIAKRARAMGEVFGKQEDLAELVEWVARHSPARMG